MLHSQCDSVIVAHAVFQWAPTLGGECYTTTDARLPRNSERFNGHPPLGVNATSTINAELIKPKRHLFQWAPTLGGECYIQRATPIVVSSCPFQWAPTLGGECYNFVAETPCDFDDDPFVSMGTHPWG